MKGRFLARAGLGLAGVVFGALGAAVAMGGGMQEARADATAPPAAPAAAASGSSCVIKGTEPVAKGVQMFDAASGGQVIASFVGTSVPLQMSELPADMANGRAKIATSTGSGQVRIEGYVPASSIDVYTTRDLSVMAGNVWVTSAQKVKIVRASSDSIQVERTVAGTRGQTVKATATCDALALQRGTPVPVEVPPNGRGYLTKDTQIELFDKPNGDSLFTLLMLEGSSQLFWSTESRAGFVHVKSRGDLALDGWVKWKSLDPLKKGEMMDQYVPPSSQVGGANLTIEKPPPVRVAKKEIVIRARRDEKAKPIGVIEAGAEIYVMETVAGWSNILPKTLHILPPNDGGFWIQSTDTPSI